MGQRANLAIQRDSEWQLYYDHWCANRLDIELFWGAAIATQFIEQRRPVANRDDWLDETWCEGGAIVDHDNHLLLWYGGEDILQDIPSRKALLELMASQWTGWKILWASGGVAELGAYFGYPPVKTVHGFWIGSPTL